MSRTADVLAWATQSGHWVSNADVKKHFGCTAKQAGAALRALYDQKHMYRSGDPWTYKARDGAQAEVIRIRASSKRGLVGQMPYPISDDCRVELFSLIRLED
jgi:hypothetical protein